MESLQASPSATTRQAAQAFFNRQNALLRQSIFDIHYSIFSFQCFLSDQTGCPFAGGRANIQISVQQPAPPSVMLDYNVISI